MTDSCVYSRCFCKYLEYVNDLNAKRRPDVKLAKTISNIRFLVILLFFALNTKCAAATPAEWSSNPLPGGLALCFDSVNHQSVKFGEEVMEAVDMATDPDPSGYAALAVVWGKFTLTLNINGRVEDGYSYFRDIEMHVESGPLVVAYGVLDGAQWAHYQNVQTRVRIKQISFLEIDPQTDRATGLYVERGDILDTGGAPVHDEPYRLAREVCVPRNAVVNVLYEIGSGEGEHFSVPNPIASLTLPPLSWRFSNPGPDIQMPDEVENDRTVIFGYVFSSEDGHALGGVRVNVRDSDHYGDSDWRGNGLTNNRGYYVMNFSTPEDGMRQYVVYTRASDGSTEIVEDATGGLYYGESTQTEGEVAGGEIVPVVFYLDPKQPPSAAIISIDPVLATEGEAIHFEGRGFTRVEEIRGHQWVSDLDDELSTSSEFDSSTDIGERMSCGLHTIFYRVRDDHEQRSGYVRRTIRINRRPHAHIESIEPNPVFENDPVTITIHAYDEDGIHGEEGVERGRIEEIVCFSKKVPNGVSAEIHRGEPVILPQQQEGQPDIYRLSFETEFRYDGNYEIMATARDELGGETGSSTEPSRPEHTPFQGGVEALVVDYRLAANLTISDEVSYCRPDGTEYPLYTGLESRIRVTITNNGGTDVMPDGVKLLFSHSVGDERGQGILDLPDHFTLRAGESRVYDIYWTPQDSGTARLDFKIDNDDVVNESNEGDNRVVVRPTVYASTDEYYAEQEHETFPGPDLTFTRMWVEPNMPRVGQEATIRAIVVNQGDQFAEATTNVRFTVGRQILNYPPPETGTEHGPPFRPPLPAGGSEGAYASWTPTYAGEDIRIRADVDYTPRPSGQVMESSEINNSTEIYIGVLPEEETPPATEESQPQQSQVTLRPDLELIEGSLDFSAPSLVAGQEIKISAKVRNNNIRRLSPVEVEFWVDEKRLGEAKMDSLKPGKRDRVVFYWTPAAPGQYTIYAVADPRDRFEESDEGNNRDSHPITIAARTPEAEGDQQRPQAVEPEIGLLDLELIEGTLDFSGHAFGAGQEIKIAAKVRNRSTKRLSPVEVKFEVDGKSIGMAEIDSIKAGETQRVVIFWTPREAGRYTVYATVDPGKRFQERNRENNKDYRDIIIGR